MEKNSKATARKRGQPAHAPTAASRRKVAISAGGGTPHEHIALALGISTPTLRKHYQHELSIGASKCRQNVLQAMYDAATRKGSTAAAKVYLAAQPEVEAPPVPEGEEKQPPAPVAEPAPLPTGATGKKEQAKLDATTAARGTDWESLLPKPGVTLQ